MKNFSAKTVEEAVAAACEELHIEEKNLVYTVTEEKKGLFKKSATIAVYEDDDAAIYAQEYIKKVLEAIGIGGVETEADMDEGVIKIAIDTEHNSLIIGKNGRTLQSLNDLTKLAVANRFRKRYRILLDVGGYKEDKYHKIKSIAKRVARDVLRSHVDVQLDPMTPDERRIVHNVLSGMEHIKTESTGDGNERAVWIKYVE